MNVQTMQVSAAPDGLGRYRDAVDALRHPRPNEGLQLGVGSDGQLDSTSPPDGVVDRAGRLEFRSQ